MNVEPLNLGNRYPVANRFTFLSTKKWPVARPLNSRILESQATAIFPFKDLVTHRVSLDNINDGLRIADSGKAIRVAILP